MEASRRFLDNFKFIDVSAARLVYLWFTYKGPMISATLSSSILFSASFLFQTLITPLQSMQTQLTSPGTNTTGMCPPDYDYTHSNTFTRFEIMRDALLAQERPILYSLCEWGEAGVQQWGSQIGSSWRMSGDIEAKWSRILSILNQNTFYLHNTNFWGHSDADMLEVGNEGVSIQEARTHFALWAAMKSPLLIGADLAKVGQDMVDVLKNPYLLAFNQDDMFGTPAMPYKWGTNPDWTFNESFPAEFWAGESQAGTLVLMFNPSNTSVTKSAVWEEVPELEKDGSYAVVDVWTGEDLGCVQGKLDVEVPGHDTAALLVGESCDSVGDEYGVDDEDRRVGGRNEGENKPHDDKQGQDEEVVVEEDDQDADQLEDENGNQDEMRTL